jgi:hypothetical protein
MFVQYESRFGAVEIATGHLLISKKERKKKANSSYLISIISSN